MLRTVIIADRGEMTERGHYGTSSLEQGFFSEIACVLGLRRAVHNSKMCGKLFFILNECCCTLNFGNGLAKKAGSLELKAASHLDSFLINIICPQKSSVMYMGILTLFRVI